VIEQSGTNTRSDQQLRLRAYEFAMSRGWDAEEAGEFLQAPVEREDDGAAVTGPSAAVCFDNLPGGRVKLTLWLKANNGITLSPASRASDPCLAA
jgi:hypothetical protein